MKTLLAIFFIALLPGCSSLMGTDYTKMSADQISAAVKDKDSAVICIQAGTPWGKQSTTMIRADKGVVVNGAITVDGDCKASFSNQPPPPRVTIEPVPIVPPAAVKPQSGIPVEGVKMTFVDTPSQAGFLPIKLLGVHNATSTFTVTK